MNADILVSVIIPTYSRNVTLSRAINSVLCQTYTNIEIIIVDDNPADSEWRKSTNDLMTQYLDDKRIIYIKNEQNLGGSGARNEGIKVSKGEYIAFLDDDDEYFPERIKKQLELFLTSDNDKLALVFCDAVMTHNNDKFVCNVTPRYKGCCLYEAMRDNCLAATSQWMAKKSALIDVGLFTIATCKQDSLLILKLLSKGYEVDVVPEILSKYCNYDGERISSMGIKNLNGTLFYKRKCEELYVRLTKEQINEVEYAFACRLYPLFTVNKMYSKAKDTILCAIKIHPLKAIVWLICYYMRLFKYSVLKG